MFINKRKKIIYFFILVFAILSGIKSYAYIKTGNSLTGVDIVKPAQKSSVNGIAKISAKTFGKTSNVDFIIKNNADGSIKTAKAFFENAANEWSYYLNSMEITNGEYTIDAFAYNGNIQFNDSTKIKIENDGNDISATNILADKNTGEFIDEDKKESEKNEIAPIAVIPVGVNVSAVSSNTAEKATTTEINAENQAQILNAVVKALSNIYDTINNNLSASENMAQTTEAILEGKVAGTADKKIIKKEDLPVKIIKNYTERQAINTQTKTAEITGANNETMQQCNNEKNNKDTANAMDIEAKPAASEAAEKKENNWFKYDIKLSGIENGEKISDEKTVSASCNNPLDSVVFIIDNLDTPEIDYKFNALNNYGYYTYWTYKLNPNNIKKGEYLLYARGTIDWQNYESPMIIVEVE